MSKAQILEGDCREVMRDMPDNSVDAIVTDPPYGLSFMGKGWDFGVPGEEFWIEALRVAKPGSHLLAAGGTRTYHRLACAIEDAGWEIRDCVMWVYGSGFPKSHDISKAIDKAAGAEREVVGQYASFRPNEHANTKYNGNIHTNGNITAPATDAAKQWAGWGTALKPSYEPWILARKPLDKCTVAENVLRHGTGAINVDGCRVGTRLSNESGWSKTGSKASENRSMSGANYDREPKDEAGLGRFPANLIHDGSDEVVGVFPVTSKSADGGAIRKDDSWHPKETVMPGYGDSGSAARFFKECPPDDAHRIIYTAKASKRDRDEGLPHGVSSTHPTVKPTSLMRYLCRLITPPGGVVLDPFCGSGSTGKGAVLEGFRFIGIEREAEYVEIARKRVEYCEERVEVDKPSSLPLFEQE